MFSSRHLMATILLVGAVGACGSAGSTAAGYPYGGGDGATATPTAASTASRGGGGGGATGAPVAQGGDYCGLLGSGDFAAVGITGTAAPSKNSDAPTDAYCVYAGTSSGTGGIEFDIFIGDADATYQQIRANAGIFLDDATADLPGVDAAGTIVNGSGGLASIAVKKGQMSFDIGFPSSAGGRDQLLALARVVLARSSALV